MKFLAVTTLAVAEAHRHRAGGPHNNHHHRHHQHRQLSDYISSATEEEGEVGAHKKEPKMLDIAVEKFPWDEGSGWEDIHMPGRENKNSAGVTVDHPFGDSEVVVKRGKKNKHGKHAGDTITIEKTNRHKAKETPHDYVEDNPDQSPKACALHHHCYPPTDRKARMGGWSGCQPKNQYDRCYCSHTDDLNNNLPKEGPYYCAFEAAAPDFVKASAETNVNNFGNAIGVTPSPFDIEVQPYSPLTSNADNTSAAAVSAPASAATSAGQAASTGSAPALGAGAPEAESNKTSDVVNSTASGSVPKGASAQSAGQSAVVLQGQLCNAGAKQLAATETCKAKKAFSTQEFAKCVCSHPDCVSPKNLTKVCMDYANNHTKGNATAKTRSTKKRITSSQTAQAKSLEPPSHFSDSKSRKNIRPSKHAGHEDKPSAPTTQHEDKVEATTGLDLSSAKCMPQMTKWVYGETGAPAQVSKQFQQRLQDCCAEMERTTGKNYDCANQAVAPTCQRSPSFVTHQSGTDAATKAHESSLCGELGRNGFAGWSHPQMQRDQSEINGTKKIVPADYQIYPQCAGDKDEPRQSPILIDDKLLAGAYVINKNSPARTLNMPPLDATCDVKSKIRATGFRIDPASSDSSDGEKHCFSEVTMDFKHPQTGKLTTFYLHNWQIHSPSEHIIVKNSTSSRSAFEKKGEAIASFEVHHVFAPVPLSGEKKGDIAISDLLIVAVLIDVDDTIGLSPFDQMMINFPFYTPANAKGKMHSERLQTDLSAHQQVLKHLYDASSPQDGSNGRTLHSYYTYDGSLTTPPCTEIVNWIVMEKRQKWSRWGAQRYLQAMKASRAEGMSAASHCQTYPIMHQLGMLKSVRPKPANPSKTDSWVPSQLTAMSQWLWPRQGTMEDPSQFCEGTCANPGPLSFEAAVGCTARMVQNAPLVDAKDRQALNRNVMPVLLYRTSSEAARVKKRIMAEDAAKDILDHATFGPSHDKAHPQSIGQEADLNDVQTGTADKPIVVGENRDKEVKQANKRRDEERTVGGKDNPARVAASSKPKKMSDIADSQESKDTKKRKHHSSAEEQPAVSNGRKVSKKQEPHRSKTLRKKHRE